MVLWSLVILERYTLPWPFCFDSLVSRMPSYLSRHTEFQALSHAPAHLPDFQGPGSSVLLTLLVCLDGITELPGVPILEATFFSLLLEVSHPLILSQFFSAPTCQPEPRMRHWSPVSSTPFNPTSCLRSGGLTSLEWHCPSTVLLIFWKA